eukprot:CAMPEP_0119047276 /NCGR_PEP_ID=MMETSP1177-20130426/52183_1 /TAXON_ID=2985 /ORGANISM="Ochromonas sp, Strain CCMP1899" /LENGTH=194 /DNA_ID=CAMNT_0007021651 /DNA_START=234 /DNA_END=815 /DNA_ORIENTATION=-
MLKKPVNETKVDDEIVLKGSVRRSILPTTETEGLQIELKTTLDVDSVILDTDIVEAAPSTPVKVNKDMSLTIIDVSIMEATCVQMVVDAFANELENQGVSPKVARDIAVKSYLGEPEAFSPKGAIKDMIAPRRRDSLLASLEKKATNRTEIALGTPVSGKGLCLEESQLSSILISALTDNDMEIIDTYACHLET